MINYSLSDDEILIELVIDVFLLMNESAFLFQLVLYEVCFLLLALLEPLDLSIITHSNHRHETLHK